jgi:hypothetical protein
MSLTVDLSAVPRSSAPLDLLRNRLSGELHTPDDPAYDRAAQYSLLAVGMAPDPTALPHARRLFAALAPWDTGGIWPNFAPPHDADTARRAYRPATLARLAAATRAYDPHGVLQAGSYTRSAVA